MQGVEDKYVGGNIWRWVLYGEVGMERKTPARPGVVGMKQALILQAVHACSLLSNKETSACRCRTPLKPKGSIYQQKKNWCCLAAPLLMSWFAAIWQHHC
jgi:hypothetical protein